MCGMMQAMGYFNRDSNNRSGRDNRGGGRGFGGGRGRDFGRGGRDDSGPREMFKTVCSNCGKECEVPFKPTTGKPVYCSDCFEKMGGRSPDRSDRPDRSERNGRSDFRPQISGVDNSKQLNDLNAKLDKIIALLTPKLEPVVIEDVVSAPIVEEVKEAKPVKAPKIKKVSKK